MKWHQKEPNDYGYVVPDNIDRVDGSFIIAFIVAFGIFALIVAYGIYTLTPDHSVTKRILKEDGYTDISITGSDIIRCGRGDKKGTTFTAKNAAGNKVSGVVCCGVVKGCTIRR